MSKKYYIETLGCPKNFNDSEYAAGVLDENGYEYFKDVKKCSQGRDARFVFSDGSNALVVTVPYAEGLEVFIASTPDNPLPGRRTTIIRRIVGTTMDVTMDMQFSETREVQEK